MAKESKAGKTAANNQNRNAELDERRERLSRALEKEYREQVIASRPPRSGAQGLSQALRLSSEFAAAILVGAVLGWGLDKVAGISPWGLIVFLLLGFVAGVLNVIRASGSMKTSGKSDIE